MQAKKKAHDETELFITGERQRIAKMPAFALLLWYKMQRDD